MSRECFRVPSYGNTNSFGRYFDWTPLGVLAENFLLRIWRRDLSKQVNCTCVVTLRRTTSLEMYFSWFFFSSLVGNNNIVYNYRNVINFIESMDNSIMNIIESCIIEKRETWILREDVWFMEVLIEIFKQEDLYVRKFDVAEILYEDIYYQIIRGEIKKSKNIFSFEL